MKKLLMILLLAFVSLGFNSCDDDDDANLNLEFNRLQIVDAQLPESFVLGETYAIQVTFIRPDGCTYFQGFDVYPGDTTVREVVAVGARYANQVCTEQVTEVTDAFLFNVVHNEDYTFRFFTGEDADGESEYLEVQVPVVDSP